MPDVPGTVNFPADLDNGTSLLQAANNAQTALSGAASSSDTTLTVATTTGFPSSGAISIEGEVIFYTGTTATTFTGCLRGQDGTTAASHDDDAHVQGLIVAAHHNTLADAIIATQTKLGSGASSPSSGTVLQGNGTGTSAWSALPDATTTDPGLMSAADKTTLDSATSSVTVSTLMQRDANGRAQVAAPSASGDIATKGYVDSSTGSVVSAVTGSGGITSTGGTTPDVSITDGGVTDTKLGSRTVDDTLSSSANSGTLTQLLSWLAGRIKGITGKSDWKTAPAATLEDAANHIANTSNPHSTTAAQTGALAASHNLSDLNSTSTARTNLGLGTSATLNAPATGNASSSEVVKGDDTRLTDNRTPGGTAGGDLAGSYPNPTIAADAVTDAMLGDRTIEDTSAPASDTGTLTALLSRIGNVIKSITGKSSWRTAPDATLGDAASHIANTSNPHSTTAAQTGALATANNLSDLGSASTARTNLSLGTSATLNVAASGDAASGEVVKGSDTRLTNSRPPSGSAGGHLSGTYPNPALAANSGTDAVIGNRTLDQTTAMGGAPNTGNLTTLLGRIGNIIKAITGKTNWSDTPDITLSALNAHKNRHVSGGADAFASTDVIEAVVKRLQETSGPTNLTMGSVADGQFLKRSGSSIVGAAAGAPDYIHIRDEKASGTDGGSFNNGAWRTRDLNTEVTDTGNHCTLSSNQLTLAAGTYEVMAMAPASMVGQHRARLQNVTDGTTILLGQNGQIIDGNVSGSQISNAMMVGQFTLTTSKTLELQHRCDHSQGDYGFGRSNSWDTEVYSELQLWKVA